MSDPKLPYHPSERILNILSLGVTTELWQRKPNHLSIEEFRYQEIYKQLRKEQNEKDPNE
jgi:hypothetical protein